MALELLIVLAAILGLGIWKTKQYLSSEQWLLQRVHTNDPYLERVRTNRKMSRTGNCVVYITDEDTCKHYRYDKGSEQRQIRISDVWVFDKTVHPIDE
jgi:hypothetical protein